MRSTIDDALKERIRRLADLRQRSAHSIMHQAIEQCVTREEARESFKRDALASWQAYRKTGRHLTGQQARDWLNTWGTKGETDAPA